MSKKRKDNDSSKHTFHFALLKCWDDGMSFLGILGEEVGWWKGLGLPSPNLEFTVSLKPFLGAFHDNCQIQEAPLWAT